MSNILTLLVTFVIFSFGALATFFYQERCSIYIGTVYRVYADVNVLSTAIELYRKDNKKLPNSLDDLIPEYLREIIPDP